MRPQVTEGADSPYGGFESEIIHSEIFGNFKITLGRRSFGSPYRKLETIVSISARIFRKICVRSVQILKLVPFETSDPPPHLCYQHYKPEILIFINALMFTLNGKNMNWGAGLFIKCYWFLGIFHIFIDTNRMITFYYYRQLCYLPIWSTIRSSLVCSMCIHSFCVQNKLSPYMFSTNRASIQWRAKWQSTFDQPTSTLSTAFLLVLLFPVICSTSSIKPRTQF